MHLDIIEYIGKSKRIYQFLWTISVNICNRYFFFRHFPYANYSFFASQRYFVRPKWWSHKTSPSPPFVWPPSIPISWPWELWESCTSHHRSHRLTLWGTSGKPKAKRHCALNRHLCAKYQHHHISCHDMQAKIREWPCTLPARVTYVGDPFSVIGASHLQVRRWGTHTCILDYTGISQLAMLGGNIL